MYRLLAIDLDGTLLTPQHTISSRTRHALEQAIAAGVTVVIATGQKRDVLQAVCAGLPLHGPQIMYNGALVADIETGTVLYERLLPPELVLPALSALRDQRLYRAYFTHESVYVDTNTPGARDWYRPPVPPVRELDDITSIYPQACLKLIGVGSPQTLLAKRQALQKRFQSQLYVTQSSHNLIELLHPDVSKENALRTIAAQLGIAAEEIMALGDSHNDVGMLRFAGMGVAMGNASAEVKAAARSITTSNAEHGVAVAIEQMILSQPSKASPLSQMSDC
ncbi:MAG TPA: Cof-type HAD-IIB family hydrolase [Ktedonobacteraceae bacterium]|nr:Cof-type HAD-IIB family hydrolase [Ktedonobacteraceae bacterium]